METYDFGAGTGQLFLPKKGLLFEDNNDYADNVSVSALSLLDGWRERISKSCVIYRQRFSLITTRRRQTT